MITKAKNKTDRVYQQKHREVAGYLPQDAEHIGKWLSLQIEAALEEQKKLGSDYVIQPSIIQLMEYINNNPDLKEKVVLMIKQGLEVHKKYAPNVPYGIDSLTTLYLTLNYLTQRAPIFAPDIPHTAFPISGLFVYMMFTDAGWDVFRNTGFNDQLRNVLDAWCKYLDSSASLNVIITSSYGWLSPESIKKNNLNQFVTEAQKAADPIHWGFKSYNDFFHRNIIDICRPIDGIDKPTVIVSANDGTVNKLARNVQRQAEFWLKGQPYSLVNMLDNSPYLERFVGGDVLQTFLSGHDYHRFHAPISGTIKEMRIVPAFMFSELRSEGFDASAGTLSQEYEANVNTRALIFIESDDPKIGMVCVMPIGITEISSIKFNAKIEKDCRVTKGQLLGRFSYGGSSLCTIFQPGAVEQFTVVNPDKDVNNNDGPYVRVNAQTAIANKSLKTSKEAIDYLINRANTEPDFLGLLTASLNKAEDSASTQLDECLFEELDWPTNVVDYGIFLAEFSRWKPQQSNLPAWKNPANGNAQEVYDRLCHFYYLIDQPVGPNNSTIVQNIEGFDQWLVDYANLWGSFLNTPESFNDDILESFKNTPKYRVQDSMIAGKPNNPSGWLTFNQFFARELNPGLRPIDSPFDNKIVVSPADCTYRMQYPINEDSTIEEVTVKKTHTYASIKDLLKNSKYKDAFGGGTFVHYFLGPYSYHRFHTPVSGIVEECYAIQGLTYLNVNLKDSQFDAPDNSMSDNGYWYEFSQARGVITIDTTNSPYGNIGIVAVIPVGMCQVSSVNMTAVPGSTCLKGDEFGYFLFGGSDIILLFQEGVCPEIATEQFYRHYGSNISMPPATPLKQATH